MPQTNQLKIFISHSWEDKPLVRRLEKELQAAGAEVWVDHEGIRGGDNLPERISEALEWCNTLVLVWSKTASQSRWVKLEWTNAISLERAIIPCRVDNATLPAILAHKAYVAFSDIEAGLAQLLQALRLRKPSPSAQAQQVVEPPARVSHSPFPEASRTAQSQTSAKPSVAEVIRLRSTPAKLSEVEVKVMLRKYDFYCKDHDWSKDWSNPQGKGIDNKFELQQNGLVVLAQRTGLMWQQGGSSEWITFAKAEEYVRDSNAQRLAGFNDWRLPTLEEAMSLMKREKKAGGLYIDPVFDRTQRWIWTADKTNASSCWVVNFYGRYCNVSLVGIVYCVRLVR